MLFVVSRNSHCLHEILKFGHTVAHSLCVLIRLFAGVSVCLCMDMCTFVCPFCEYMPLCFVLSRSLLFTLFSSSLCLTLLYLTVLAASVLCGHVFIDNELNSNIHKSNTTLCHTVRHQYTKPFRNSLENEKKSYNGCCCCCCWYCYY